MARARRNVASPPPQQPQSPSFEDFVAASGAAELLPPEAAVAAVPVAGALTTAAAAAAVVGVLGAFATFNRKRERALRSYLTGTLTRLYPDRTREEILRFVRDELARDREFVRNQQERLQKDLVEAMKLDAEKRGERVQAVLDRERRYTQMHEQAAIERAAARTSFLNVKDASPQGALWMLGPAKTHTPSCVGMAGKFWPWQVLDKLHPQLHAGCQCYLVGKGEAVERGFMHEDQANVDPKDALRRAAEIAKLEDIVMEAASPEEIRAYLDAITEAEYRLPKGVHGGGEFAKRGETGVAILARHSIEKMLRKLAPRPSTPAQRRRDAAGEWRRIGAREVYVPEHRAWERELDGKRFYSPPQSTTVYKRDDYVKKPPVEVPPEKQEQVTQVGQDLKAHWRARAFEKAQSALAKQDKAVSPVEVGDNPQATHQGLTQAGFYVAGQQLPNRRGGPLTRMYEHPATQARVEVTADKRSVTHVGWHPGRKPQQPKALLDRPPTSQDEFFDDVFSQAHAFAAEYGKRPQIQSVRISGIIEDMGGQHTWQGVLELGRDTHVALAALDKAREENRPLTYRESRFVYSLYRAAAHEALHAAAPIRARVFADANDASARGLEEALTEELASIEGVNMLRRQGLTDVLRWVKANPTDYKVEGNYSEYRTQLSRILDRANVPPEKREDVIRTLKFSFDPEQRADGLAALVAAEDRAHGMNHEQSRDWISRIYNRADDRTWRPMSSDSIFAPNIRPDLSDVPDEPPVVVGGETVHPGSRVKLKGRAGDGVVQAILRRDEGPLFDVQFGLDTFKHGVHPDEIDRVGKAPEGVASHVGEVRIDGQTYRPGDTVSYLADNGRTRARVERIIRASNPDIVAPRRGWQMEARTEEGVPVLLDHGRARGFRREVASDMGYDAGVAGEVMQRATPGGERQAEPFKKYGPIPEKIKWVALSPGLYESADKRLTMYRIEGVRPPAWNVEWTIDYGIAVQNTGRVEGYSSPVYEAIVDGAATIKDAKGFADDEWPRLREVIAAWEAPQPQRMTPGGIRWTRGTHPTGVPIYTSEDAPGLHIEAVQRYSTHSGMVFGNYANEAGRESRTEGWRVIENDRQVGPQHGTLAQAKAAAEKRVRARQTPGGERDIAYHVYPAHERDAIAREGLKPGFTGTQNNEVFLFRDHDEAKWYADMQERDARDEGFRDPGGDPIEMRIVPVDITGLPTEEDHTLTSGDDEGSSAISTVPIPADRILFQNRQSPGGERDEDYRGSHTAPDREPGSSLDDPTSAFGGDEIYGPNALHYYGSGGPSPQQDPETQAWARRSQQASRESLAAVQAARGNPDHLVTIYRAVPKDAPDEINPGDWVTPSRTYAEIHGESNLGGYRDPSEFKVLSRQVRAGDLYTDGDLSEWGWVPQTAANG